ARRVPRRPLCLSTPAGRARAGRALLRLLQPLDHLGGDIEARVGGDDIAGGRVRVENQRVVAFGAQPLDHGVDASLDRLDQGALMNAILSPGCACARALVAAGLTARKPIHAHTVTTRLITISLREERTGPAPRPSRGRSDQKKLPSLKCSLKAGAARPNSSVRSNPYAQSMPMGPSGEIMLSPRPAPRYRRVGSNSPARAHTLPASKNALM